MSPTRLRVKRLRPEPRDGAGGASREEVWLLDMVGRGISVGMDVASGEFKLDMDTRIGVPFKVKACA